MKNDFTSKARAAAQEKRRCISENKATRCGLPSIFAVRVGTAFGWEARKYGGVIVGKSEGLFETPDLARMAGDQAALAFEP